MNKLENMTKQKYDKIHDWRKEITQYKKGLRELAIHPHKKIEDTHIKFIKTYGKGKKVLEVGCGVGHITKRFAKYAQQVTAIDFSDVVKYAKKINNKKNITYLQADVTKLPFMDESFDIIIASEIIEHIPNPNQAIKEMKRVLVNGGLVYLSTPNLLTLIYPLEIASSLRHPLRWINLMLMRTNTNSEEYDRPMFPWTLKSWFKEEGFSILEHNTKIYYYWRKPYIIPIKLLDKMVPFSTNLVIWFLRITDAIIESKIPLLKWAGTRQFIIVKK